MSKTTSVMMLPWNVHFRTDHPLHVAFAQDGAEQAMSSYVKRCIESKHCYADAQFASSHRIPIDDQTQPTGQAVVVRDWWLVARRGWSGVSRSLGATKVRQGIWLGGQQETQEAGAAANARPTISEAVSIIMEDLATVATTWTRQGLLAGLASSAGIGGSMLVLNGNATKAANWAVGLVCWDNTASISSGQNRSR
ncbi:hypothetical protein RJ55_05560 [Drechmeria coniospora]|nr:hypothetical protein RJ55_05560 [Drechmeria coniospora]